MQFVMSPPGEEEDALGARGKKRRVPKACASCRNSKLRCDGGKPCLRCREKNIWCDYVKGVEDPVHEKLVRMEAEIDILRRSQSYSQNQSQNQVQDPNTSTAVALLHMQAQQSFPTSSNSMPNSNSNSTSTATNTPNPAPLASPSRLTSHELYQHYQFRGQEAQPSQSQPHSYSHLASPASMVSNSTHADTTLPPLRNYVDLPLYNPTPTSGQGFGSLAGTGGSTRKRKRGDFELTTEVEKDVVSKGVLTYEDAVVYFRRFFEGCDKYVPVFDPRYDTFESVRERSSMLFDVICAIGCRAEHGPSSEQYQALTNTTKTPICAVILGTAPRSIETIQALLLDAGYGEKGWLLTSLALKLALELDLPGSYARLSDSILAGKQDDRERTGNEVQGVIELERRLMRESRVWFGVWVLEHILSIDCGKNPGVKAVSGEVMRRYRVLLDHPARTSLDFRLLAQVELNSIRALAHERLSPGLGAGGGLSDEEMNDIVQGTRIDLNIWLNDWVNLVDSHIQTPEERASLVINMKIQRDWSEMTMLCKGLQGMGIENVAIMSDAQRNLIHLAKNSAKRHLSIIMSDPSLYLATFRYGMDFVWAKCAFSVLLLLKLTRVAPQAPSSHHEMTSLIADARTLLAHLSKICGSSNIYFRILALSVEKCEKALNSDSFSGTSSFSVRRNGLEGDDTDSLDPEVDFQSYVPKEFTLEWNFPGLTFCWIPMDWMDLFADVGAGF